MMCFQFSYCEDKDEAPISPTKSSSIQSFTSESTDRFVSGPESSFPKVPDPSTKLRKFKHPSFSKRSSNLREFKFSELKSATKNFSLSAKLGEGGFGSVYSGTVKNLRDSAKDIDVAVKQLGKRGFQANSSILYSICRVLHAILNNKLWFESFYGYELPAHSLGSVFEQGHKEWVTEVNVLGIVQHPNLVKLVGYCAEDHEKGIQRLLVYEYMPNRCVEYHLSNRSGTVMTWAMRLKVAQDTARGLAYLHEGMDFQEQFLSIALTFEEVQQEVKGYFRYCV
ncbi:hypothetical protein Ccrd_012108 [Cynara cardunculus var. scolymus]|uniref:Protein kinase domain-containing protein n=1 Tax=Cynara cardunculus var. scolymus TaxID=59895 RepID=A0A103YI34_CYNCS|nr:hypothetical protein Ccrd_012108 [Cynara cardunculus var. scolymus]